MALDDDIAILSRAPLLGLMSHDALRLISFAAERRALQAGETLFHRGAPTDGGYVVLAGTLVLAPRHPRGEPVLAEAAALVGRNALLVDGRRPAAATAGTPCEVLRIPPALMHRVLAVFPEAAAAIHDALADDLAALNADLDHVRQRFAEPDAS